MTKIAIITDTDSSLPQEVADEFGIYQVPITIHFDDSSYTTGVDIDERQLFEKIDRLKKLPTTSAPAPGVFADAYEAAFSQGADSVICICVSSKVSATYASAVTACQGFAQQDITVVDSLNLSMGQGFMVLSAAESARSGATKKEVLACLADTGSRLHTYAVLATLKYLALSGRVGKVVAGMADTLNIKPILSIKDGKLDLLERIRTWKKAEERVINLTHTAIDGRPVARAAIIHVNDPEGAEALREKLCAAIPCPGSMITADITPGLAVHTGSGMVGVVVLTA